MTIYKTGVVIKKRYYPTSRVEREPIRYSAKQPDGTGSTVFATIYLDPILRKYPDLERALIQHETNELKAWGKGQSGVHALARSKEPKALQQIGGVSGFWREIARREKRKRRNDIGLPHKVKRRAW